MSQHFLLSAKARTLSIKRLFDMKDEDAFELFRDLRWGSMDQVVCPCCGSVARHYFIQTRRQWRCRDCKHTLAGNQCFGNVESRQRLPGRSQYVEHES